MNILKLYAITLPIFFAIDIIWLGVIARSFYAQHLGFLMRTPVNWTAAMLFYLIFIFGLVVFVIQPALAAESLQQAVLMGALFGFVTYATYDLTNLATLKDWPLIITIVDLIWGTVLGSTVATLSFIISSKL